MCICQEREGWEEAAFLRKRERTKSTQYHFIESCKTADNVSTGVELPFPVGRGSSLPLRLPNHDSVSHRV